MCIFERILSWIRSALLSSLALWLIPHQSIHSLVGHPGIGKQILHTLFLCLDFSLLVPIVLSFDWSSKLNDWSWFICFEEFVKSCCVKDHLVVVDNVQVLKNKPLAWVGLPSYSIPCLVCLSPVTEWLTNQESNSISWSSVINSSHGF